jgi:biopolymer transport protein ExbD
MASTGSGKKGADINVVPLIDIVLVLLIIFMVITPLIVKQMDVHTPDTEVDPNPEPPPPDQATQVILLMGADGKTYIGKEEVARADLPQRLTNIYQGRAEADKVIFFDAEDNTNYGESVKVLDIARGAGANKIGIVTDRTNLTIPTANGGAVPLDPNAPAIPPAAPAAPTPAPAPAPKKK